MSTLKEFNKTVKAEIAKITASVETVGTTAKAAEVARGKVTTAAALVDIADSELLGAQQTVGRTIKAAEKAIDESYFSLPTTDRPAAGSTRQTIKKEIDYLISDMWK